MNNNKLLKCLINCKNKNILLYINAHCRGYNKVKKSNLTSKTYYLNLNFKNSIGESHEINLKYFLSDKSKKILNIEKKQPRNTHLNLKLYERLLCVYLLKSYFFI